MTSLIAHELRSQRGPNAFSLIRILLSFKREIPLKIKVFFKALGQDLPAIGLMGKAVSSTDKEDVADGLCFMKQLFSNDHSRHSGGSSSDSGDEKGSRDNPTGADVYDDRIDLTSDHGNSVMMQNIVDGLNHFNQQDRRDVDLLAEQVCGLTASNRKYQSILEKGYDDLKERDQSQIQVMRKYELEMKALSDSSRNQLRAKEDIIAQLHKTHKRQTSMLEERISQIQGLLTSKEEALQAAYTTSKQHRERTLILQAELSESAQRTANLEGKVKEMAKHTTEKDEELQDAETRVKIHSTASEQLKLQLEVSHKNLKGAKDQYVSLQKKNKQKGKHLEEVYQKLIIVTKAFQEKTTEFVKLESAKAELSELLDDARERILEMEEAHASRSSELQDAHSRCESLESNLADRTAVIDTLQSNIDSVTRDNRELEGTAMKQEQQVKALKLASERLTHALKEREAEVESHQNLLQQKEKQLEQHSTLTAMIHNLTLKAPANENGGGDSNTSMRRM